MINKLFYFLAWVAVKLGIFKGDWTNEQDSSK
jgi:hypothetical protein